MRKLRNLKITTKLTIVFVLFAVILLGSVSALAFNSGRSALEAAVVSELLTSAIEKEASLGAWVNDGLTALISLSQSPRLDEGLALLVNGSPGSAEAQSARERVVEELHANIDPLRVFQQLTVLDAASGKAIVSTNPQEESRSAAEQPYFIHGRDGPYVQSFYYSPELQRTTMTVSTPVLAEDGRLLGVLAGELDLGEVNAIFDRRTELHQTDDAYLVTRDFMFITRPRFLSEADALRASVHTAIVDRCTQRASGYLLADDYRGTPVIGVYRWLPEQEICLVVKLDQAEAFAPSLAFGRSLLLLNLTALAAASLLAVALALTIVRPLKDFESGVVRFGQGNLAVRLQAQSTDELGVLAREFNQMADALQDKDEQIRLYTSELEQRAAERSEELYRQTSLYETLLQAESDLGECILLAEGRRAVYVNDALCAISGYSRDELLAMPDFTQIMAADEMPATLERAGQMEAGDEIPARFETELVHPSGRRVKLEASAKVLRIGERMHLMLIARDITERKRADERFQLAVEAAPNAVILVNQEGLIVLVNSRVKELFGYEKNEMLGGSIDALIPERFRSGHPHNRAAFFADLRARPMGAGRDLFGLCKDGREVPIEIGLTPLDTSEGTVVMASIIDITARKQIEAEIKSTLVELKRSNQELEQFAYVASHDLQEPLRMVSSYMQLIARRYQGKLDSDADEFITFAVEGANRMKALINDLLTLSRVGTHGKEFSPVALEQVVDLVESSLHMTIEETQAAITRDPLPQVMADESQMMQLFMNLVGNALKFHGPAQPRVHIGARWQNGQWLLSVSDNGIGLEPQFAERIFVIFQRLHAREEYPGTGIGLAVCRKIVERHGGRIWVESQSGEGATFFFILPAMEKDIASEPRKLAQKPRKRSRDTVVKRAEDLV